jgi:hypothetical protein
MSASDHRIVRNSQSGIVNCLHVYPLIL